MTMIDPTLAISRAAESPDETLRRLDVTVSWMWSTEPVCHVADRHQLLRRLGMVSTSVERLVFRHEFELNQAIDIDELDECGTELDDLNQRWFDGDRDATAAPGSRQRRRHRAH